MTNVFETYVRNIMSVAGSKVPAEHGVNAYYLREPVPTEPNFYADAIVMLIMGKSIDENPSIVSMSLSPESHGRLLGYYQVIRSAFLPRRALNAEETVGRRIDEELRGSMASDAAAQDPNTFAALRRLAQWTEGKKNAEMLGLPLISAVVYRPEDLSVDSLVQLLTVSPFQPSSGLAELKKAIARRTGKLN